MTPAERELVKHAQKELVALCGGIDKVRTIVNYGRSTIGRWSDVGDPSLMPLAAIIPLQRHCHMPVVTMAMAAIENRLLTDPEECAGDTQCVFTVMAETIVASGALNSTYGTALADGKLSLGELTEIDKALAHVIQRATAARKVNAALRSEGGLKVVGKA